MLELIKDSELVDDDPPFNSSTSPGSPIPIDLRVAGFNKRNIIFALMDDSREIIVGDAADRPNQPAITQEIPGTK